MMKLLTTAIVLLALVSNIQAQDDFIKMAEYLSKGSGKWYTENPNYDPGNEQSSKGYGLWFTWELNRKMLRLQIIGYRKDTLIQSTEALWSWHPGKKKITYYAITTRGSHYEGTTEFASDDTFITLSDIFVADGRILKHKDENIMLSDEQHQTRSSLLEDGQWKVQGSSVWDRLKE